MIQYGNSVRLEKNYWGQLSNEGKDQFLKDSWKAVMHDAHQAIENYRIINPDVFLLMKKDPVGDMVIGWYIGDNASFSKRNKKEKWEIVGKLTVKTSEKLKNKTGFMNFVREKIFGVKPDPKTLNPYIK